MIPELAEQFEKASPELKVLILRYIEAFKRQLAISASLTPNVVREMAAAVPTSLVRDIVNDSRRGVTPPSSLASDPDKKPEEPTRGTGHYDPAPLRPPPGVEICDRLMDVQDLRDKAALIDAAIKKGLR